MHPFLATKLTFLQCFLRTVSSGISGASYYTGTFNTVNRSPEGSYVAVSSRGNFYLTWEPGQVSCFLDTYLGHVWLCGRIFALAFSHSDVLLPAEVVSYCFAGKSFWASNSKGFNLRSRNQNQIGPNRFPNISRCITKLVLKCTANRLLFLLSLSLSPPS